MSTDSGKHGTVFIYGLYTLGFDEADQVKFDYFYVGRSIHPDKRIRQHLYRRSKGHEDIYADLRRLDEKGVPWDFEILDQSGPNHYAPDAERWHIINLTGMGTA